MVLMNGSGPHESLKGEKDARQNGHEEADPGDDGNDQEVIVIQDTGFTVKICAPAIEPFSLQVPPSPAGEGNGGGAGAGGGKGLSQGAHSTLRSARWERGQGIVPRKAPVTHHSLDSILRLLTDPSFVFHPLMGLSSEGGCKAGGCRREAAWRKRKEEET